MDNNTIFSQMRSDSRQRVRLVWELAQLDGLRLSDEDRGLVEVMQMHPEYADLWPRFDELSDEEIERDGTNPIMHVTIHQTLENQIADDTIPQVGKALARLMQRGRTRHEALHEIGAVLAAEMFEILRSQLPFDERGYVRQLRKLGQLGPRQKKKRKRKRRRR